MYGIKYQPRLPEIYSIILHKYVGGKVSHMVLKVIDSAVPTYVEVIPTSSYGFG